MNEVTLLDIPLSDIELGPNIRQRLNEDNVKAIAVTAKEKRILTPIEVVPGSAKLYDLVDGLHRIKASELLGFKTIPAIVRREKPSNVERVERQLCLNGLRTDLNPIEKAKALEDLTAGGKPKGEVGASVGMSAPAVSQHLALLRLSERLQEEVASGRLGRRDGYALSQIDDPAEQTRQAERLLQRSSSVNGDASRRQRKSTQAAVAKTKSRRTTIQLGEGYTLNYVDPAVTVEKLLQKISRFAKGLKAYHSQGASLDKIVALANAKAQVEESP